MSRFFTDYREARHQAHLTAVQLGLTVALRATTEFGKAGFAVRLLVQDGRRPLDRTVPVSSATWHLSDSDELKAERVEPTDWCDCAEGEGCRG